MADDADRAQQLIDATVAAGIARVTGRVVVPRTVCMDCDETIPSARAALGVETCIECQEVRDEYAKKVRY